MFRQSIKDLIPLTVMHLMAFSRKFSAALLVATLAATLASIPTADAAGIRRPRASTIRTFEAGEYASTSFADSWDFKAGNDLPLVRNLTYARFTDVRIEDGRLQGTAERQGHLRLLQSWNSLPNGRDGALHPIDADRFSHISIRMRLTGYARSAAELSWYDCGMLRAECKGGLGFWVEEGWHTYDIPLVRNPAKGDVDWEGTIRGLVFTPSAKGGDIEIDWIRLYEPQSDGVRFRSFDNHPDTQLIWDKDRGAANNNHRNPNWGVISEIGEVGGIAFWNTDAMPPGKYFVYTLSPNGKSGVRRLVINGRPRPFVIEPNAAGGRSYDAVVRGDAWDFNSGSDVGLTRNMTWTISNGQLIGTNTGSMRSDSGFRLPIVDGHPIDAQRFHRLTIRVFYEGGFGLTAGPGGGMNARIVWRRAGGGLADFKVSDDIVVSPGWNTISLDLDDFTPNQLVEGGSTTGWTGSIGLLRFDPHEDSGTRRFHVDYITLAEDDAPTNNRFDITFRDRAWEPESTARIYLDRDKDAENGQLIATTPVERATNTFTWTVPPNRRGTGEWYVTVEVVDRYGQTQSAVSGGSLTL